MIKSFIRWLVSKYVGNDILWAATSRTLVRGTEYLREQRRRRSIDFNDVRDVVLDISPDLSVKYGPFAGMKYPEIKSVGSSLVPKIIGSYERELHPLVEKLCGNEYTEIVDIGCAEGYYAVGFAMRIPGAKVYAYDTNDEGIELCRKMAEVNGVAGRLETGSFCDGQTLLSLPLAGRALIVSDCEGYENELFTPELVARLGKHDFLVEVHDFLDIDISAKVRESFEKTHSITIIRSIDDITKAHTYQYDELSAYPLATKRNLLAENRPRIMEWFYFTPLA
ncbi:MAG: class I SAM-dependent methyltransferase [Planctomycetes bacterium]|nr:class I SAM-dependent methyltransferase [Planctomycetota bacterium]